MARPKSKKELIEKSKEQFQQLCMFIDLYTLEEQKKDFPPGTMNRNIRDVLMHLHHWHLLVK